MLKSKIHLICPIVAVNTLIVAAALLSTVAADTRSNVLFIISDDLNDWVLHPPGHPKVKTPNIDRLRESSTSFSNAHVPVPVCGPSRKCLFSGLYPQTINDYGFGAWDKNETLRNCVPLPLHFRNHGYSVYGTGKLLHEGAEGDFYTAYGIDPDYGPWPSFGQGPIRHTAHPAQYEEWKDVLPLRMHRDLNYGPLTNVPKWNAGALEGIPGAEGWYYEDGRPFQYVDDGKRDAMPDEISANWAVDILNEKHDRPFFLGVGFVRPHSPLYAPQEYFDRFPIEEIELPPYLKGDLDDCATVLRERWQWGYRKYDALIKTGGERAWKEWVQAYLACIAFVDDQIGKMLDALEASPYRENTIVILTSDHGYHVGEKNCIQKWHLWNESTKVPLFIRAAGHPKNGLTCGQPVSAIDLYPTLIDLCGLPKEPNEGRSNLPLDGHSLQPFVANPNSKEWDGTPVAFMGVGETFDDLPGAEQKGPHHSVVSSEYRYTLCSNGEEELYDHTSDPHEWTNLAKKPSYAKIKKQLRGELLRILHSGGR